MWKTPAIAWLLARGHRVCGAELSQLAVEQLFVELGVTPEITEAGPLRRYSAGELDVFCGDIFALTPEMLGPVDAIFDRAALVAFPESMRAQYAAHLVALTKGAPQLLICFRYDQTLMDGPPWSLDEAKVRQYYAAEYAITPLETVTFDGKLRGKFAAEEDAWLLSRSGA